ncbi:MAG TPA: hypothetical protein VIV60_07740 [Polyangiaceae bacterium]
MHAALAGSLAGLLHVVSGPDHLVAVAPLAMKRPLLGLRVGVTWGIGHATGVVVVGLLGVLLRSFIDIEALARWAEFVVGFVLVGVGVWAIVQMRKFVLHRHPHHHRAQSLPPINEHGEQRTSQTEHAKAHHRHSSTDVRMTTSFPPQRHARDTLSHATTERARHHDETSPVPQSTLQNSAVGEPAHAHIHVHQQGETHDAGAHHRHHTRGSFFVGLVHGAAGTGHLLGVLPSLALPPARGIVYLACYGIAAVVAMGAFGMTMGVVGHRLRPKLLQCVMLACGVLAIGLGMFWLVSAWRNLG